MKSVFHPELSHFSEIANLVYLYYYENATDYMYYQLILHSVIIIIT